MLWDRGVWAPPALPLRLGVDGVAGLAAGDLAATEPLPTDSDMIEERETSSERLTTLAGGAAPIRPPSLAWPLLLPEERGAAEAEEAEEEGRPAKTSWWGTWGTDLQRESSVKLSSLAPLMLRIVLSRAIGLRCVCFEE